MVVPQTESEWQFHVNSGHNWDWNGFFGNYFYNDKDDHDDRQENIC